jgi:hypothetical protein
LNRSITTGFHSHDKSLGPECPSHAFLSPNAALPLPAKLRRAHCHGLSKIPGLRKRTWHSILLGINSRSPYRLNQGESEELPLTLDRNLSASHAVASP